jgi:hypothetical protein
VTIAEFKFGPWLPDQTDHKNPGLEVCKNVIPGQDGYKPARSIGTNLGSIEVAALSARMFQRADGTRVVVAASATDLYTLINGTDVASGLALTLTDPPQFERYGSSIYACCRAGMWVLDDIETDTQFVAASWTKPNASTVARISDFLVVGDMEDVDASDRPYGIRWSQFNNPQGNWTSNVGTQCGSVNMPADLGKVMAITGGTSGLVFQRNGVSRLFYTGGGTVFGKQVVTTARGAVSRRAVVQVGGLVYFLSDDGFFVHDGNTDTPISGGRVWEWFLDNVGQAYLDTVEGAVDWQNRCVVWSIPSDSGEYASMLYFNWETGWWSWVNPATYACLVSTGRDGLTLEQVSALYPDLDAMELSLDDSQFLPGERVLGTFRTGGQLRLMDGSVQTASFETGEFQVVPGKRTFVDEVTPLITCDSANVSVRLTGRNLQTETATSTDDVVIGPLGFAPFNFDARYFRVLVSVDSGDEWSDAYGFLMSAKPAGRS